jgi:hypothetical protein
VAPGILPRERWSRARIPALLALAPEAQRLLFRPTGPWIVNAPEMTAKAKAPRKPPTKAYAHLPEEDVDALVAYMQSLKK